MSDLNKLLEDLSILIFEADKSKRRTRSNLRKWSKNFEHYKIVLGRYGAYSITTQGYILNEQFYLICQVDGDRVTAIMQTLKNCVSPEIFSEINKTIDKIVLLIKLERMKNEQT